MRWITEATGSGRTLYRRCQRVGHGQQWGDESLRQSGFGTDALSLISTCRSRAAVRRWITEATGSTRTLYRRC